MEDDLDFDLGFDLDNGGGTKTLYGIDFPADMPDELIHLKCWKHWREEPYIHGNIVDPWDCFWRGIYGLVPKEDFVRHTWAEQHVYDWTTEDFLIVWGAAASGKALRLDAIVYTPDGPRTMGELEVGDTVLGPQGDARAVCAIPFEGMTDAYAIRFSCGTSLTVSADHLWKVYAEGEEGQRTPMVVSTSELPGLLSSCRLAIPSCSPDFFRGIRTPSPSDTEARYIVSACSLGRQEHMKCISVDDPDGLYVIDNFIVTHNSNDFGMLCLVDWLVDPSETVAVLASTTLSMLKLRSFESVTRYFHKMKRHAKFPIPGKLSKTTTAVLLDDKDDGVDATDKASVRGVAVSEGTEDEARAKLQGAHLPYVRLILDELSQMRSAAMAVRTNLAIGAKNFKLIGLCNPDGFNDLAGRYSVPDVPGGYSTLDPNKDFEWRSTYGKVRRHDGLQSPAIIEPDGDRKYPFLLTQKVLDELLRQVGGNWDDPQLQTMIRAWPPAEGKRQTLLSVAEAVSNRAQETVTWMDRPMVTVIGVDPAFTEGGNKGVMQALDVGLDVNNQIRLFFREPRYIRVAASSKEPILAQVGNQIIDYAEELHVPPGLIGVDDSATQSVVDYLQHQRMWKVNRFIASRKPLEAPITQGDRMSAKDRFYNQSVELWAATAAFIRAGQVRGFPDIALEQLTTRPTEEGRTPIRLVSKRTKARDGGYATGDSPDEMDAVSYAVGVLRYHLHFIAGMSNITAKIGSGGTARFGNQGLTRLAQRFDLDAKAYQRN